MITEVNSCSVYMYYHINYFNVRLCNAQSIYLVIYAPTHTMHAYTIEVEQNLAIGRTQSESLDHWKICDTLFPSTIAKNRLSLAENIKYRLGRLK